jgi:hypothetical protein
MRVQRSEPSSFGHRRRAPPRSRSAVQHDVPIHVTPFMTARAAPGQGANRDRADASEHPVLRRGHEPSTEGGEGMTQLDYLVALVAVQRVRERLAGAFTSGSEYRPVYRPGGPRPHARSSNPRR